MRTSDVLDSGQARTVIYDMRSPDDIVWGLGLGCDGEVREMVVTQRGSNEIKHRAVERGILKTLRMDGARQVIEGKTTVEEVLAVTQMDVM